MAVTYSITAINYRLQGVVTAIGSGAHLLLTAAGVTIASIALANPCGTVSGGVLTFTGSLSTESAIATGYVDSASIVDSAGTTVVSNLSVGIPGQTCDIVISNGVNSTLITDSSPVLLLSAQIIGS